MIPYPKQLKYRQEFRTADTSAGCSQEIPVQNTQTESVICPGMGREEYHIRISREKILLEGGSDSGLFYARTTLEQLKLLYGDSIPCMEIRDYPAYPYRSFHIDCARHYFPTEELKKMIRISAEFRLNHFHWHFSDDQGWRIESRRYPKLHETGSVRKGDHFGTYSSDRPEGGYYTQDEVRDIVSFCRGLGIEVVPEIDMPGHVTAILAAYPELSCLGRPVKPGTKAGIYKELFCAGKEEVYTFIENLLGEMLELFPGKYFHIGGDEAPKERWRSCPHCQKRMKELGLKDTRELQGYMENRIIAFLRENGRIPIVWNEAAYGGNLDADAVVQVWTDDQDNQVKKHLKKGGTAILSKVEHCYCDYPYGMHSLKDVYSQELPPAEYAEERPDAILGAECLVWTEFIRDNGRLEELAWPRFAALAEAAWCGSSRPGYKDFCSRLEKLTPLFAKHGIHITPEEGWTPAPEQAAEETRKFQANFSRKDREEAQKAQEDI